MDLYFLANVGHYVTAVFDFVTDENNDFGLRNGFVILGNLDVSPFFVTIGHHRRLSLGHMEEVVLGVMGSLLISWLQIQYQMWHLIIKLIL